MYTPNEEEVSDMLTQLLEEMIGTLRGTTRVIDKLDSYVKMLNTEQKIDLMKIITSSVRYQAIVEDIRQKVSQDFTAARQYVNDNFEQCRVINDFDKTGNLDDFLQDDLSIEVVKSKIKELRRWNDLIQTCIKDTPKGVLQVDGKNIKKRLDPHVKEFLSKI
jgi:hypothetical protein